MIKSYAKFSATPKYMTYNWASSQLKPLKYVEVLTQDFNIHPNYLASIDSSFESCKTVRNVIHVLLTSAADQDIKPGGQFVVKKNQLLQNR